MTALSSYDVCRLAGITYRQLDYWVRTGLLVPDVHAGHGSGGLGRRFSVEKARQAQVIGLLMHWTPQASGNPMSRIARRLARELPDMPTDTRFLVVTDNGVSWASGAAELAQHCAEGRACWVVDLGSLPDIVIPKRAG